MSEYNLEFFQQLLKNKGLKVTPQRIEILNQYYNSGVHPTADEAWNLLRKKFPSLSKATIYNIFESFSKKGLVHELKFEKETRFDFDTRFHVHLLCRKCGQLYDIYINEEEFRFDSIPHKIEGMGVIFYGICEKCLKSE